MPANRSRTLGWRRCLKQVHERQGAVEIALASHNSNHTEAPAHDLVWRVRLLDVNDLELIVEQPSALGQPMQINGGAHMIVVFAIGQNRWTFTTTVLPSRLPNRSGAQGASRLPPIPAIHLAMPDAVQRCQRRQHDRLEIGTTGALHLPQVEIWPLLDPKTVLVAERASELRHAEGGRETAPRDHELAIPEVGPRFTAVLANLGGGGVGLRVKPHESQALARHKLFWMRLRLDAGREPICATCKLVHTHMESNHDTYAGMAFDFSFNPNHQRFVVEQISNYVAVRQAAQTRAPSAHELRKVA